MSYRPDLHTPHHDQWDQGGYCNNLVIDDDGCGTVCGYRKPRGGPPMTEQSNADLIAEAREGFRIALENGWARRGDAPPLAIRLAERLEAADQRAAELAAVVEKVRDLRDVASTYGPDEFGVFKRILREALATAPADALREHDAVNPPTPAK